MTSPFDYGPSPDGENDDMISNSDMSISPLASPRSSIFASGRGLRSPSPAPSVMSFNSSDRRDLLRETHGRAFNTQNETWMLPADSEELSRHEIQHRVLTGALGSLYAAPELVQRALAPRQSAPPGILDVGTGGGQWAIDMAMEFRHAEVLGIDLAPPILEGPIPSNLRFEIDDVNLSLNHYSKCFDVVHCRSIDNGIQDYEALLYSLAEVLRPRGVLLLARGMNQLFDEHLQPLVVVQEGSPGFSPIQNMFAASHDAAKLRGGTEDTSLFWKGWLENNDNYEQVGTLSVYVPIGAWQNDLDERARQVAELNRMNAYKIIHSMRTLLVTSGFQEPLIDRWLELAAADLKRGSLRIFARWEWAWAVRKNARWVAQPDTKVRSS